MCARATELIPKMRRQIKLLEEALEIYKNNARVGVPESEIVGDSIVPRNINAYLVALVVIMFVYIQFMV